MNRTFSGAITNDMLEELFADKPQKGKLKTYTEMLYEMEGAMIIRANKPDADGKLIQQLLIQGQGSYGRLRTAIEKHLIYN
jgi:hypothetical protein